MKKIVLTIDGMMCAMCEAHVKDAIRSRFPGAKKLKADHSSGHVSFILEEDMPFQILKHDLRSALDSTGYRLLDAEEQDPAPKKGFFARFKNC